MDSMIQHTLSGEQQGSAKGFSASTMTTPMKPQPTRFPWKTSLHTPVRTKERGRGDMETALDVNITDSDGAHLVTACHLYPFHSKQCAGFVRSPEQKDYKMQRCLTRIISIESESRQGSGDGGVTRRGRPDESASYVADLERAKDPIAVVRPRVRHLTLHEAVNDSPKRPNQLLLPFSYNKEISKVDHGK